MSKKPFIRHESKCMGKGCRNKATHETLRGLHLCPECIERVKDPDFELKKR